MAINGNEEEGFVMVCDHDGCEAEFNGDLDFRDTVKDAKAAGWQIQKGSVDWYHFCPDHRE